MQNKGFIITIATLLVLICGFYISFSFVTAHYEREAESYAERMSGTTDATDDVYNRNLKHYHDSIGNQNVWLGNTYNQARQKEIGLGLDLKGGMNVVLEISVPEILLQNASSEEAKKEIQDAINKTLTGNTKGSDKDFISKLAGQIQEGRMASLFRKDGEYLGKLDANSSNQDVAAELEKEVESQVDAAFNIFRTRIDQFGVVSPNIQKLQDRNGQILLELPGVKEPERVTELLKSSANLQFYEVYLGGEIRNKLAEFTQAVLANDSIDLAQMGIGIQEGSPEIGMVSDGNKAKVEEIFSSNLAGTILPPDFSAVFDVKPTYIANGQEVKSDTPGAQPYWKLIALKGDAALEGDVITNASTDNDAFKGQTVNMKMNDRGTRDWATLTRNNIGRPIAIVLDNAVYSYPRVNDEITGGSSEITGNFTVEEANDLANVLKSGKMTARVEVVSNNVIGPSLGATAVQQGFLSFVVAIALLMVFMILIYGLIPGLVANVGLILNLYFTLGILASLQAVLTLSGIAGIVLALGMAVDANVLIFERIKEELALGKKLRQAITEGYGNAFSAIFDSNLTSIITGIILLLFGSGPIKGFATTLIIGLVCSFFTAVFLTRIAMELITKNGRCANMSFTTPISRNFLSHTKINFLGKWKISSAIWLLLIVVSIASLAIRGMNQGIDFSGGRNYVVQFDKDVNVEDLRTRLTADMQKASNDTTVSVGVITIDNPSKVRISTSYKINDENPNIEQEITDLLYQSLQPELTTNGQVMDKNTFTIADESRGIQSIQKVGPSVADDMRRDAYWAVSIAIVCMFLYILLRFRNIAFSVGAVAAVALTAFLIIGFYSICWGFLPFSMEIDQSFIAAVLTIIGYQINDTVVVFDRVREMMKIYPKENRFLTFNKSLNTTLTRTIMTSFSTLLVLGCIFFLGGDTIRSFTFAMIFGVIVGTFCSLYCAAPIAYHIIRFNMDRKRNKEENQGKPRLEGNRRFR